MASSQSADPADEENPPSNYIEDPDDDDDGDDESPSAFELITRKHEFEKLIEFVSEIQKACHPTPTVAATNTADAAAGTINNEITGSNFNINNRGEPVISAAAATTTNDNHNSDTTSAAATNTTTDAAAGTSNNEITESNSSIDHGAAPVTPTTAAPTTTDTAAAGEVNNDANGKHEKLLEKDVKHIVKNVKYIRKHIESLKSSRYRERAEDLLQHLIDAAKDKLLEDFKDQPDNLNHLLQIVARLIHWIPPQRKAAPQQSGAKSNSNQKKKKDSPFLSKLDKENAANDIIKTLVGYDCEKWELDGLLKSYEELEVRDKLCLLCFSAFPCDVEKVERRVKNEEGAPQKTSFFVQKNLVLKKKVMIYWWVGEGFIDPPTPPKANGHPPSAKSNTDSHPNQISKPETNPSPSTNTDLQETPTEDQNLDSVPQNPDSIKNQNASMSREGNQSSEQVSPLPGVKGKTIEEIGDQIMNVLREKGFIEPVIRRGRETGYYQMLPFVHAFVCALAKRAGFFDFSNQDGKLSTRFSLSQRACLLKAHGNTMSSCKLWKDDCDNRSELKKFATVQTLFNVNESIIDIKPEWFSKMKYLSVLHLGSWRSETAEHIEVEDQKFMEDLKNMKQLKLFSLQGVATVMKLPDSLCELSNLIILDLRECHNLEQLPAGIGALKNLTHLDITNCHLLTKLPIGISLLSKLEVLNGFVIYEQEPDQGDQMSCISRWWKKSKACVVHDLFRCQNKEECTLKDLLKLAKLRELSIVVNRDDFPCQAEVEVLKKMGELCTLKISWMYDFKNLDRVQTGSNQGNSSSNGKSIHECGRCPQPDNQTNPTVPVPTTNGQSSQKKMKKLQKLELWCYPCNTAPDNEEPQIAVPTTNGQSSQKEMKKLQKLELWCYPCNTAPDWLVPDVLTSLKKLYIKGGQLNRLNKVKNSKWNVEMLSLKYLSEFEIEWTELKKKMFPNLTYLEKYDCPKLGLFPCNHEGIWKSKKKN